MGAQTNCGPLRWGCRWTFPKGAVHVANAPQWAQRRRANSSSRPIDGTPSRARYASWARRYGRASSARVLPKGQGAPMLGHCPRGGRAENN
eukprot:6259358-Pyramimonas_sp.AAC.1